MPIEPLRLSANQWQFLTSPGSVERYVEASGERKLVLESTRRQFRTAVDILCRLNGSHGGQMRRGILLADDVGLGKTTVAALVAWVIAGAGEKRNVRVLAPNDVMVRRWEEELLAHVGCLHRCAPHLGAHAHRVKARRTVHRLAPGSIQVVKHSYATLDANLKCDLLIVDEAHRAKGDESEFSRALKKQRRWAGRVLILTATPFSIELEELNRMLMLVGGEAARPAVRAYKRALEDLYAGNAARDPELVAERLALKAKDAVEALSAFVIRHGIEDLPLEKTAFGERADWAIVVPPAKPDELELMLRMDRVLRLAKAAGINRAGATNDARFHVGWRHLDEERANLAEELVSSKSDSPTRDVVSDHLQRMSPLRKRVGVHSKMRAVAEAVRATIAQDEKVLLFCHHIATAQELAAHLAKALPKLVPETGSAPSARLRAAWDELLPLAVGNNDEVLQEHDSAERRATLARWLSSDLVHAQTSRWLQKTTARKAVSAQLGAAHGRSARSQDTLAEAGQALYRALLQSRSSRSVLDAASDTPGRLPGARGSRVFAVCPPSGGAREEMLFSHQREPDTIIAMFNSPFGPDVLVVSDRLSEGIDLHRYCRHLIHYELDPSPIRTVQRNGRLRRVNSWAAATGQPIRYAYPAFRGTRDHRLVQIMKKRVESFSLLLGGVQDIDVDEVVSSDEAWRNAVISIAKRRVLTTSAGLGARK